MKKSLSPYRALSTLLLVITALSAFSQTNPLFRHLPPNATQVFHINLPALTSKLSWNDIISNIPPSKNSNDQMMAMLKDPAQAGIDINQDIFVTQGDKLTKLDSIGFTTILVHLTDSGKFGLLVNLIDKDIRTFRLPQGRAIGKDKMAIAYDSKLAVITIVSLGSKPGGETGKRSLDNKKAPVAISPNHTLGAAKRCLAALQGFPSSIYTTDPVFLAGFSDDADFHMWMPQGAGLATLLKNAGKKNQGMADALTSNTKTSQLHVLTALRFDAGKMSMRTTIALPPDSAAFIKKFNTRPLNTDLIARLPGKDLLGMVNMHFDLSVLTDLLDKFNVRKKIDSSLSGQGFTTADIQKAFKGDFLLAAVAPTPIPGDTTSAAKIPAIYFVTTINDLGSFMKVASKLPLSKDSASGGKGMFGKMKTAYTLKDNILVISSNKLRTDGYFSGTTRRSTELVSDHVANSPVSIVVDIKAVAAYLQGAGGPPSGKTQQMLHFMQALDRLTIAGGRLVDGTKSETYIELKMADASENSLRSIFKLLH